MIDEPENTEESPREQAGAPEQCAAAPADENAGAAVAPSGDETAVATSSGQQEEGDSSRSTEPSMETQPPQEAMPDQPPQVEDTQGDDEEEEEEEEMGDVEPLELIEEPTDEDVQKDWYILKVSSNREASIADGLRRRVKVAGLDNYFGEIIVPTEDVAEFKGGKKRIVKRKLYPGYIVINVAINDETWFLVRETPGIGDFTGSAGKPTAMNQHEIDKIRQLAAPTDEGGEPVKTAIPFKTSDRVRIKEGTFENFEGDVEEIDEANGRVTVMINIFGRSTPVELEHWQIESV